LGHSVFIHVFTFFSSCFAAFRWRRWTLHPKCRCKTLEMTSGW
jgi:hypothetical protein